MKKLYQVLVCLDDMADSPQVHKKTGDGILDTLFIRGRHYTASIPGSPRRNCGSCRLRCL